MISEYPFYPREALEKAAEVLDALGPTCACLSRSLLCSRVDFLPINSRAAVKLQDDAFIAVDVYAPHLALAKQAKTVMYANQYRQLSTSKYIVPCNLQS